MGDLETSFMTNPVTFLKEHAFSPPDGAGGTVVKEWTIANAGNIESGENGALNSTVRLRRGDVSKVWATFHDHGLLPGAKTIRFTTTPPRPAPRAVLRDAVPMYWLPWDSLAITRIKIAPVPTSLVDPPEDEFPRFFMTAGINGCSVFVEGPPEAPTIYHAGITGKLARRADDFWVEQLNEARRGTPSEHKPFQAVHKYDYMGTDRAEVQRFIEWKQSNAPGGVRFEHTNSFGALIGVRFGRQWSFYLQESAFTEHIQMLKRNELDHMYGEHGDYYALKGTNTRVNVTTQHKPRRVGGIQFGQKRVKTFSRVTHQTCSVVQVGEIYPTRTFHADFQGKVTVRF